MQRAAVQESHVAQQRQLYRPPSKLDKVVGYDSMFAENPNYSYKLRSDVAAPTALAPITYVKGGKHENPDIVLGTDRLKFFKQPVISKSDVGIRLDQIDTVTEKDIFENIDVTHRTTREFYREEISFGKRDMGTQSDYRENEAQTDPYSPEVRLPDNSTSQPEVLAMTDLKWPDGNFKVTDIEERIINRVRRRRQIEANLPKGLDEESFQKRLKMLKELETVEWSEREEQMQEEQEDKLLVIKYELEKRERDREMNSEARLAMFKDQKDYFLQNQLEKIEQKRLKGKERIMKKYGAYSPSKTKRDLIEELSNTTQDAFSPSSTLTKTSLRNAIQFDTPLMLTQPRLIDNVAATQTAKVLEKQANGVKTFEKVSQKAIEKRRKEVKEDVDFARKQLNETKKNNDNTVNILRQLYKVTPRVVRPKTPTLECDDDNDEFENAAILVQKLLRGRATQNTMFEGKERTISLIEELIAVQEIKEKEKSKVLTTEEKLAQREQEAKELYNNAIENIQGDVISKTLDFLSKELVRQEQMKRIEQFAAMAEMEKNQRDEEEQKRREVEEQLRLKQDIEYENIININSKTADMFLGQLFQQSISKISHRHALLELQEDMQKQKNHYSEARTRERLENNSSSTPNADEIEIKDLVSQFIIPQVNRSDLIHKVEEDQKKFSKAVHEEVFENLLENIEKQVNQ